MGRAPNLSSGQDAAVHSSPSPPAPPAPPVPPGLPARCRFEPEREPVLIGPGLLWQLLPGRSVWLPRRSPACSM